MCLQLKTAPVYRKQPRNPTKKTSANDGQAHVLHLKDQFIHLHGFRCSSKSPEPIQPFHHVHQLMPILPEKSRYLVYCPFSCTSFKLLLSEWINKEVTAARIKLEVQPGSGCWPSSWPFSDAFTDPGSASPGRQQRWRKHVSGINSSCHALFFCFFSPPRTRAWKPNCCQETNFATPTLKR